MNRAQQDTPTKLEKGKKGPTGNPAVADVDQLLETALAHHQEGHFKEAETLYRQILETNPDHTEALHMIGVIAHQLGNNETAQSYIARSLALEPDFDALNLLGVVALQTGRNQRAVDLIGKTISLKPEFAEAHGNLGKVHFAQGRPEEAADCYRRAIALRPDFAGSHSDLGDVLNELGRLDEALASYRKALVLQPQYAGAHYNLGNVLKNLGRLDEAVASYRKALALEPDMAAAHINLGSMLWELGRLDEAAECLNQALELTPNFAGAHYNLGNVHKDLGRLDEAVSSYRKAVDLAPHFAGAHYNLGNVLKTLGRLDEAVESLNQAITLKPKYPQAHNNLGNVLKNLGRLDEAVASYRSALALKPDFADAQSNLIYTLKFMAEPSSLEIKAEAEKFGDIVRSKAEPFTQWNVERDPHKRLRVGMVSGDFRGHVVRRYQESFLGHIDRAGVEFVAYSNVALEDAVTARLKPHFATWRKVAALDDSALANLIHDDAVDILIDLASHSAFNRLPMFAYRPAPVQATWLGLFVTSGVPGMDYILADPYLAAPGEAQYFTETIWPLAESWFCLDPPALTVEPGPLPALESGFVTFGCFNNLAKMTDEVVALWAKVLDAVPGSSLFLKTAQLYDPVSSRATLERFGAHGIAPERLVLEGHSPLPEYFAAYRRVDLALDPFPFHGATTTLDGLWMGVPALTRRGDRVGTHLGESIANNAGLGDWIADDEDDYVAKAVALTSDLDQLAALRAGLRARVLASPLYDGARFAGHFEAALRGMWRKACGA